MGKHTYLGSAKPDDPIYSRGPQISKLASRPDPMRPAVDAAEEDLMESARAAVKPHGEEEEDSEK